MNIMILVCSFPPRINSAAHLYFELSESLKKNGHNITVITEFSDNIVETDKLSEYKNRLFLKESTNGIDVLRLSPLTFLSKFSGGKALRFFLSCLLIVIRGIFTTKPDAILVYSPPLYTGLAGYIIAKLKKTQFVFNIQDIHPKVLIDMGFVKNPFIIKMLLKMEDLIYKKAHSIIVYSKGNMEYLIQKGVSKNKIFVIPNWVDTELIIPSDRMNEFRKEYNLGKKFIVSYAGSMQRAQGLETIIEAAEVLQHHKDIFFLLVGNGEAKPLLQKMIEERNLDNVILLPLQPKEKYAGILIASDICLLPLNKNLPAQEVPGKLPNLMASGRPIVATVNPDGDAAKTIIKAKCGYCIEPGNIKKLTEAILVLYRDDELREKMGKDARRYSELEFSRTVCVEKYESVLKATQNMIF